MVNIRLTQLTESCWVCTARWIHTKTATTVLLIWIYSSTTIRIDADFSDQDVNLGHRLRSSQHLNTDDLNNDFVLDKTALQCITDIKNNSPTWKICFQPLDYWHVPRLDLSLFARFWSNDANCPATSLPWPPKYSLIEPGQSNRDVILYRKTSWETTHYNNFSKMSCFPFKFFDRAVQSQLSGPKIQQCAPQTFYLLIAVLGIIFVVEHRTCNRIKCLKLQKMIFLLKIRLKCTESILCTHGHTQCRAISCGALPGIQHK